MNYAQMSPQEIERQARSIGPGEWLVEAGRPISTLLGSCIAVCMFDSGAQIGGMNHFMLPQLQRSTHADEDILLAGDACMEALLNTLLARGASRHRIQAKAFGGGAVIECSLPSTLSIGQRNTDFAREWLQRERIPLLASDFLGPWSRKVLFIPQNGDAYCKRMSSNLMTAQALKREEDAYARSLLQQPGNDKKIELF